jgi:hypothetical protein
MAARDPHAAPPSRETVPAGTGWPLGSGSGVVGSGAIENRTSSRVGWSPFGNSDPDWVPERCAMMLRFTFSAIAWWQPPAPHVRSTTRRSLGFTYIPACAFAASVAMGLPRWQVVQASVFLGWASSIPTWQVAHCSRTGLAPSSSQAKTRTTSAAGLPPGLGLTEW